MSRLLPFLFAYCLGFALVPEVKGQAHPSLVLTSDGVNAIRIQVDQLPLLNSSLQQAILEVDSDMEHGIDVPVPKDMAGGYTHERHKKNFLILQKAGAIYQITGDEKYAEHTRDVLLEYARQFPDWPVHPAERSYAPGKIFWQCLNDANWLVYMSQAYDCIYDFLDKKEKKLLEKDLFIPLCDHISVDSPQFFNRIHNHSTWGNAGVGMMGLVMNNEELIERSLYGLKSDQLPEGSTDDDGGLIKLPGQAEAGFLAQIDHAFSPDGYYTEGPYYQRYAMYPFLLFAQAIENLRPEMNIFGYRDSILNKAVYVLLNLSNTKGEFFPFNDAQKGMSWLSRELVSSVDIIYHNCGNDPQLLSIAEKQNRVLLDDTGLSVARGLKEGRIVPFMKPSMELRDGRLGDEGGLGILRTGEEDDEFCLIMKYTGQGLSHGHYDKLSYMLYHGTEEVIQDYGLARFVNIEQKYGGGYLPENTSWAKQTIAHNTLVLNKQSHFNGDYQTGVKFHSDPYFFDSEQEGIQIVSAKDENAYKDVSMHRTMALIEAPGFEKPVLLDLFRVETEDVKHYDLPLYYQGQVMSASFSYHTPAFLQALGTEAGYQHLWLEGAGKTDGSPSQLSWFSGSGFHTLTTVNEDNDSLLFARLGANDQEFNLRRDPAFILRRSGTSSTIFLSTIESHGHYSPVDEIATNSYSSMDRLELLFNSENYSAISFSHINGSRWVLIISNQSAEMKQQHSVKILDKEYSWEGPYLFTEQ